VLSIRIENVATEEMMRKGWCDRQKPNVAKSVNTRDVKEMPMK